MSGIYGYVSRSNEISLLYAYTRNKGSGKHRVITAALVSYHLQYRYMADYDVVRPGSERYRLFMYVLPFPIGCQYIIQTSCCQVLS